MADDAPKQSSNSDKRVIALSKRSSQVIENLLAAKRRLVRNFPEDVEDTGNSVDELINGTAVFPGGTGLWRGVNFFGPMPATFPDKPIMFIGHNFDSIDGHKKSIIRGGELQTPGTFWDILLGYLKHAEISPEGCFFTNALMGLKPGSATGPMPNGPDFEEQCLAFLSEQIKIVEPKAIIALGGEARIRVRRANPPIPWTRVMHPSAREFRALTTRSERIQFQGRAIKKFLADSCP